MDMENEASWAMDQLRAANKASDEGKFLAKQQQQYVSQFRIDGQPILPPLMTADRRQQMWQLKQRALQLEAKYKQQAQCDTSSSSNTSSMSTVQRILPQQQRLQQTPTYIYDSTQQDALLETPRSRPQTLQLKSGSSNSSNNSCGSNKNCGSNTNCGIPSICVNPPTPLEPNPSLSPSANASRLQLGHTRRKLNNITSRIMRFERQADNEALPLQVLWQDKRMLRSSTSPALLLPQPEASGQQMQRSRSFTLDEPSPALLAHMQRVGQQQMEQEQQQQQQQQQQVATTVTATSPRNPRLVHATQSLAHLRRDTIESKAKQVQRSASSSLVSATTTSPATSRRCGGNSPQRSLQQQQQYLKQLLQRALHEADDVCDEQSQQERKHLTLAKRQMFKDIKLAHRDRFQQLVQYQHEEQRRMQAEFDRQQKFLIEQICADINVAVYANESTSPQAATAAPTSSASACTSTADLSPNCTSTARKRLFDGADTESDVPSEMLPLDSVATTKSQPTANHNNNSNNNSSNSSVSNKSKLKKSQQLQQQRKLPSPVPKTPPARRVINKTTTSSVGRTKPQQQQQQTTTTTSLSKTRRAASPSRQSQRFVAKK
ncbi:GATA zinc finger domain-containing protein 10 isoform X2 [Drosophila albomicans]|uniref:GATA zinc finger domain-containing protein 10 isoform X2 n=1 Tax=Drosophila albomicans TaxID=7291 RepID=A0A6P8XFV6_DROAB|nr:GATA zinc finger domain-containing protein 10 isoform X2 [Drosophila albomicans]